MARSSIAHCHDRGRSSHDALRRAINIPREDPPMSNRYGTIRFIGYAIPTTPAQMIPIGDPNGPGAVAGTYPGNTDIAADIDARIAILKNAVDTAKAQLPKGEDIGSVVNLFLAPEFYFHGVNGPYLYGSQDPDPAAAILEKLVAAFPAADYPNWSFVFGSAITAQADCIDKVYTANSTTVRNQVVAALSKQWQAAFGPLKGVIFDMLVNFIKNCHAYPCLEVRNRALIVSNIALDTPTAKLNTNNMTTEKYFVSNEDFLLYDVTGRQDVVTEQMTAYPQIDLSNGDLKCSAYDAHAIFRQNHGSGNTPEYVDFAIEICLDHSDVRLRRNIDNEPFPRSGDAVHVQLIPSCGMQISLPSVAVDAKGFVFNCDGQYGLDSSNGTAQQGTLNGVQCIYANYVDPTNANYAGHSQLARVQTAASGGDPNRPGSSNATCMALAASEITVVPVIAVASLDQYFAGGPGAVHIYGLSAPYPFY